MSGSTPRFVVAAIDFGTTYSGYAFAFKHDLDKDILKVQGKNWEHTQSLQIEKIPTVILFDKDGKFDSFGHEAERRYADLADDGEHAGWRYFKHFKMALHGQARLRKNMRLTDDQGKKMKAIDVFAAAISYLKEDLIKTMKMRRPDFSKDDILWVITVPTIWKYGAKQFMKEAALQAEICAEQLTFALEPEAGAVFCNQQNIRKQVDRNGVVTMDRLSPGSQFMVVDLGGGTGDITVSEVQEDRYLGEIYPASGGPWGGTCVDQNIYDILEEIFGTEVYETFKNKYKSQYLFLCENIERMKRNFRLAPEDVRLPIPHELPKLYKKHHPGSDIRSRIDNSNFAGSVVLSDSKTRLKISNAKFRTTFSKPLEMLQDHLLKLFERPQLRDVHTIMMIGGFSESTVVQEEVTKTFPSKTVIIPEEAGLAVLKGAVIYGYKSNLIRSRKIQYSYGIATALPFDPKIHPASKKYYRNLGMHPVCEDIFHPFIQKGHGIVARETQITHRFNAAHLPNVIEVYQSFADSLLVPSFVTGPEFERTGDLELNLEKMPDDDQTREVEVTMDFGVIDVTVQATDLKTGRTVNTTFNCLSH